MFIYLIYFWSVLAVGLFFSWSSIKKWLKVKHKIELEFQSLFRLKHFSIERHSKKIDIESFGLKIRGVSFSKLKGLHFKLGIESIEISLSLNTLELETFNNFEDANENFLKILYNVFKIKGKLIRVLQEQPATVYDPDSPSDTQRLVDDTRSPDALCRY